MSLDASMSLVAKGKKTYCAVARVVRSIWKYVMRLLTRQGELERSIRRAIAYDRGGFSADLVKAIAISLARSVQLASLKQDVFGKKPFSARKLARLIAEQKGMRDDAVIAILTWCLRVRAVPFICLIDSVLIQYCMAAINPDVD